MTLQIDILAAAREGLQPIYCLNPECGALLAYQSKDGNTLYTLYEEKRNVGIHARVALRCSCRTTRSWRPKRGPKNPDKSTTSIKVVDRPD
jgi:hypothetical protein